MQPGSCRVLVNAPLSEEDMLRLGREVEVVGVDQGDISDRIDRYAPLDGLIASAVLPIDGGLMDRFPSLQVIGRLGIGVDNIDLGAATERGIEVVHTPGAPTISTAEHAVALIYALAKRITFQDRGLREMGWEIRHERVGRELKDQCLGLIGFGRVAQRVTELLRPVGMRLLTYDPYVDKVEAQSAGVEWIGDLKIVLREADGISLHAPLTSETRHMIGPRELEAMKPGSWLVNTSRGGLIDEGAMVMALRQGQLSGAALDVFDPEPPAADNPLMKMDNVILTPHRAFYTTEGLRRLSRAVVEQTLKGLRGEMPEHLANPAVWPNARARGVTKR